MKMIILAAGQGTRLRPLTNNKPKCMVEYNNKPIIDYILETAEQCKIDNIAVVTGYKEDILTKYLENKSISFFHNKNYNTTNMVHTLFCAEQFLNDDLIISYADIIYEKNILESLINSENDFSVVIDKEWKALWQQRMDDPLQDAETLKVKNNRIIELGKKPVDYTEIEGQYIGLIKISKNIINKVISFYKSLDINLTYDGNDFQNMYMTTFVQLLIDNLLDINPLFISGGWVEIDEVNDLNIKPI